MNVNNSRFSGLKSLNNHTSVTLEAISLLDLYAEIIDEGTSASMVTLNCGGFCPTEHVFIGATTLFDLYKMLSDYANSQGGLLDGIYDKNVRKWLGKRAKSVNAGINATLRDNPEHFVAYNNGITLICQDLNETANGVNIDSPQIVNGCQTTRTLYDFMKNNFAGLHGPLNTHTKSAPYHESFLTFKLMRVPGNQSEFVRNVTRYANRQNAVRGRDFLTLEDEFHHIKSLLSERGYFLEVQTGEYGVLPKSQKNKFPSTKLTNAFDALRFYAAAVLRKPHSVFGRSGEFTPGGKEFDNVTENLTTDDLLVPWLMSRHVEQRGYSVRSKGSFEKNDFHNQTRYFYLYVLFRIVCQIITSNP